LKLWFQLIRIIGLFMMKQDSKELSFSRNFKNLKQVLIIPNHLDLPDGMMQLPIWKQVRLHYSIEMSWNRASKHFGLKSMSCKPEHGFTFIQQTVC
jgi:hypothetical protein